ncbi:MAG: response regulator [Verrucomicrobia bacterium]|nr:response regulator [Verrucomicrobiota bacterium]
MAAKSALIDPSWVRVLIVDDEDMVRNVLKDQLQPEGYNITEAESASKALDILQRENFAVILCDHEMPGMTGLDFLSKIKESHPSVTRLLLSSGLSLTALSEAIKSDLIYRFVTKPWLREEVLVTLRNAIVHNRLVTENQALHERNISLNLKVTKLTEAEQAAAVEARDAAADAGGGEPDSQTSALGMEGEAGAASAASLAPPGVDLAVQAFTKMLYTFHPNLGNTSQRAVALAHTLGEVLELPPDQLKSLIWAAALHDISLVNIDRGIVRRWLRGPEKCTDEELVIIKRHPEISQKMLEEFDFFKEAGEMIRSHHENWDGTGYPDGLKGEMIPPLARLLAVVIAYCSKHAASIQAMSEIEAEVETRWDPDAIQALAKAAPLTKMPRGEREILLIELKPGMVLARDIFNANNFLLLPKGRELSDASINKILSINRITPLDPHVLVYC